MLRMRFTSAECGMFFFFVRSLCLAQLQIEPRMLPSNIPGAKEPDLLIVRGIPNCLAKKFCRVSLSTRLHAMIMLN